MNFLIARDQINSFKVGPQFEAPPMEGDCSLPCITYHAAKWYGFYPAVVQNTQAFWLFLSNLRCWYVQCNQLQFFLVALKSMPIEYCESGFMTLSTSGFKRTSVGVGVSQVFITIAFFVVLVRDKRKCFASLVILNSNLFSKISFRR